MMDKNIPLHHLICFKTLFQAKFLYDSDFGFVFLIAVKSICYFQPKFKLLFK